MSDKVLSYGETSGGYMEMVHRFGAAEQQRAVELLQQHVVVHRLVLPYPISANRYWATRVIPAKPPERKRAMAITYVTDEAKAYKQEVGYRALAAGIRKPLDGRIEVTIRLYPHRPLDWAKRARLDPDGWEDTVQCIDLGNCEKVLSDALNHIAWHDDKQHRRIVLERMEPDEFGARVEVIIRPLIKAPIAPELPLCGG